MNYIHTTTREQFGLPEIRAMHPQMSIPEGADLSDIGLEPLLETLPAAPPEWSVVEPGAPEPVEGGWCATWVTREMTAPERSAHATQRIEQIERDSLMPRIVREITLLQLETWATSQGSPLPAFRLANKGYRLLKEADELIATLRGTIL